MSKTDDLMAKLKQTTAKGGAGVEQAKTATEQKSRRAKREKAPPAKGAGRSVSTFRYPDDDRLILHLIGEMAEKGIRANDSQIIRAALRALDQLPLKDAVALIESANDNDKRRNDKK
jgi:hypothetical protein